MRFEKVTDKQYVKDVIGDNSVNFEIMSAVINEYNDIKLPQRAHHGDAGYDFFAPTDIILDVGQTVKIATGIRVILDDDKFLAIVPRSGLGFKYRLQLDNLIGIIDSMYCESDNEGHIFCKMTNDGRQGKRVEIKKGQAFAQGIIMKYFTVDDDKVNTEKRNGGFGSSDKERK